MKLKKDSSDKKLRGAYYTPKLLADAIVNLFTTENFNSILEPSCGDGVFIDSLAHAGLLNDTCIVDAVEIDSDESEKVKDRYHDNENVHVISEDFLNFYNNIPDNNKYDLILGNPPYIRYQYLTSVQRTLQSRILTDQGMKANKLINTWVAFLVACVQLLSENGKIAFVIPAEILQVAYAEDLRLYLSNHLKKITLITFKELVFSDIEQETIVFIGEKSSEQNGISIIELKNVDDFSKNIVKKADFQSMKHVKEKWTKYFLDSSEIRLIQKIRNSPYFLKFSDYGIINVGITTGNNEYFSITEETNEKYRLGNATVPLIGRSSHAHGIYFTEKDWETNKSSGKKARLVIFPDIPLSHYPIGYRRYISYGKSIEKNQGYKCSIRDKWYIVPSVWVPDAFFLRRNQLYPKFVLNRCGAVSTDTMHRIKFNDGVDPENVLLAYYNSISFAFTEICGRSYGGGVLEILPGEVGNIMLPRIENINVAKRTDLLEKIDIMIRNNDDIEKVLDIVDQEVLVNILGIDNKWCEKCRIIWKKLQGRRLGRS